MWLRNDRLTWFSEYRGVNRNMWLFWLFSVYPGLIWSMFSVYPSLIWSMFSIYTGLIWSVFFPRLMSRPLSLPLVLICPQPCPCLMSPPLSRPLAPPHVPSSVRSPVPTSCPLLCPHLMSPPLSSAMSPPHLPSVLSPVPPHVPSSCPLMSPPYIPSSVPSSSSLLCPQPRPLRPVLPDGRPRAWLAAPRPRPVGRLPHHPTRPRLAHRTGTGTQGVADRVHLPRRGPRHRYAHAARGSRARRRHRVQRHAQRDTLSAAAAATHVVW